MLAQEQYCEAVISDRNYNVFLIRVWEETIRLYIETKLNKLKGKELY